ncbi:MAG: radical SAM protein [Anaerolineae bacterium]|nr:radical SAM protein [Anaerolineae bacterium]
MLKKKDLYRLPWSKNDNPIAWLEITDLCNLHCEGCYRQRLSGHKPLEEVKEEILFFKEWRNPDNLSIAGGEPLLHPQLPEIVAFAAERGIKPIVLTNGALLTPELLRELKAAGLAGFTLHIDSHQGRPGWQGKDEEAHNNLRQHYAEMIASVGGHLITVFNATVYPSTFHQIPAVLRWGQSHIDLVDGLVFITYRLFDTDANVGLDLAGERIEAERLSYSSGHVDESFVSGPEVADLIQECCPQFQVGSYLGGTVRHDSFKWLGAATIGNRHAIYGSVGKQTMEVAQAGHHLLRGTYLAYLSELRHPAVAFLLAPWDRMVRRTAGRWLSDVVRHPGRLFDNLHVQTIGIIQAPDLQSSGLVDMCDSCPDMTVWEGNLVNSCRLDEYRLFGALISVAAKGAVAEEQGAPPEPQAAPAED